MAVPDPASGSRRAARAWGEAPGRRRAWGVGHLPLLLPSAPCRVAASARPRVIASARPRAVASRPPPRHLGAHREEHGSPPQLLRVAAPSLSSRVPIAWRSGGCSSCICSALFPSSPPGGYWLEGDEVHQQLDQDYMSAWAHLAAASRLLRMPV
ncbi:uncharacterized protein [Triticum aestivum]|uniref:uncharacterized protein isoform X2 n=1 Tax=Triticum aestivum TaxID=4565 RepID=UPI001D01CC45|nr:uncharacterized protein LOC123182046 isoform X2 [Triticum aestivum]